MMMLIMKGRMMRKTVRMKKNKEICQLKNVAFDLGENPHSKYLFVFQIFLVALLHNWGQLISQV